MKNLLATIRAIFDMEKNSLEESNDIFEDNDIPRLEEKCFYYCILPDVLDTKVLINERVFRSKLESDAFVCGLYASGVADEGTTIHASFNREKIVYEIYREYIEDLDVTPLIARRNRLLKFIYEWFRANIEPHVLEEKYIEHGTGNDKFFVTKESLEDG